MANLLAPGVKYFCLYDNVNNNAYVIDGNDIDPGSTLEKEELTRGTNARGGVKHLNDDWSLELNFGDQAMYNTLLALARERNYRVYIAKLNGFVFWNESQRFSLNESSLFDPSSEDYPFVLNMSHISYNPDISQKLNALSPWRDSDSDGEPDNYICQFQGGENTTGSFNSTTLVFEKGENDGFFLYKDIILPFSGLQLELAVTFDQLHDDGTNEIGVEYYDSPVQGTELSSDFTIVSTTGRKTKTITLPSGVHRVRVYVVNVTGATVNNSNVQIKNPSLKVKGTTFENY